MKGCIEQGVLTTVNPCSIIVDLRKVVNHPYLIQMPLIPGTKEPLIDENLVNTAGKMLVLDAMLAKLKKKGHKVCNLSHHLLQKSSKHYIPGADFLSVEVCLGLH